MNRSVAITSRVAVAVAAALFAASTHAGGGHHTAVSAESIQWITGRSGRRTGGCGGRR